MAQQYRKRGQIDVYEPVPPKDHSGAWALAIGAFIVLAMLSQCAG